MGAAMLLLLGLAAVDGYVAHIRNDIPRRDTNGAYTRAEEEEARQFSLLNEPSSCDKSVLRCWVLAEPPSACSSLLKRSLLQAASSTRTTAAS